MSEISKAYEPQSVEDKWYQFWLDAKFFVADREIAEARVFHRHSAAERHRRAHAGPRPQQHDPGHPRPQGAHGRQGSSLAARHRSRRHRHADGRRAHVEKIRRNQASRRPGPRKISGTRLAMEGKTRRHHHPAIEKARRVVRLDARTVHDGPGIFALRAEACSWTFTKKASSIAASAW